MPKYKKWRFTIHYVKPTAQLLFKSRFPKKWTKYRTQVVNPHHQTPQGQPVVRPENSPIEYPSWVARCDLKGSYDIILNPIFLKKVHWQKYPGRREIAEYKIPSVKMLFKANTNGH